MALSLKNVVLIVFLALEIIVFGYIYFWGNYGIKQLKLAQKEQELLDEEVGELRYKVELLSKQLQDWQKDGFHKEKIARERLHMSRSNEQIYHLS
jgi:cell division protein FtsB